METRNVQQAWLIISRVSKCTGKKYNIFHTKNKHTKRKKVTHARIYCNIHPQKTETHRVRLTAGGNIITYKGIISTPTAGIETIKLH